MRSKTAILFNILFFYGSTFAQIEDEVKINPEKAPPVVKSHEQLSLPRGITTVGAADSETSFVDADEKAQMKMNKTKTQTALLTNTTEKPEPEPELYKEGISLVPRNVCNMKSKSKLRNAKFIENITVTFHFADCGDPNAHFTWALALMAVNENLRAQRIDLIWTKRKHLHVTDHKAVYTTTLAMMPMRYGQSISDCQRLHYFDRCFQANDGYDEYGDDELVCFRRADALLFNYVYDGTHLVGLNKVDVKIVSLAVNTETNTEIVKVTHDYKHSILLPCKMVFDQRAIFQIGPGNGKFKPRMEYPEFGDLVDFNDLE
ncbi:unnamed protein product, partial [Mesorhabditis belari]|uniref:Uncharacterized protein n=1 Tax=Mesorhabditis belari TaxID=2138241 RepID=A0AAF3EX53_9BILA